MAQPTLARVVRSLSTSARRTQDVPDTDLVLLARYVQERDEAAFGVLVTRHAKTVLTACRQVLADPADVDDAFQATFLVLLKKAKVVDGTTTLAGWLFAVAHRLAVRRRADNTRRRTREAEAARRRRTEADPPDLSWREAAAVLHAELNALPDTYRLPLLLCCVQGLTRDEAAAELGVPFEAVRWRLERGRTLLERRLTKRGVVLSAGLLAGLVGGSRAAGGPSPGLINLAVGAAAGNASSGVAALARGALLMTTTLKRTVMTALLAFGLVGAGLVLSASFTPLAAQALKAPPPVQAKKPADPPEPPDPEPEEGGLVLSAAYSRDGKWLALAEKKHDYLGCGEDRVTVFDAATWKPKHRLKVDKHHCRALRLSADGNTLFAAFTDGVIHTWDTKTGQAGAKLEAKEAKAGSIFGLALTPDGKILASGYHDQKAKKSGIHLWDLATGKPLRTLTSDDTLVPSVFTVCPDGKTVAGGYSATHQDPTDVAGFHGVIEWDVATGKETNRFAVPRITAGATPIVCEVAYTSDGKRVVVAGGEAVPTDPGSCRCVGYLWVFDRKTGKAEKTLVEKSDDYVRQVALSADGKKLYATTLTPPQEVIGGAQETMAMFAVLYCWDTATWDRNWSREGGHGDSKVLVVAPNGKRVGWGGDIRSGFNLFDATTGDPKGGLVNLPK